MWGKRTKKQHAECQNNIKRRFYWSFIIFPHLLTLADRRKKNGNVLFIHYYLYLNITINF